MRRLMRDEWQFGLGQISSLQRHPKPEISTGPPHPGAEMYTPTPDNAAREAFAEVTGNPFNGDGYSQWINTRAILPIGTKLFPAATVTALEAEVAYYKENFQSCMTTLNAINDAINEADEDGRGFVPVNQLENILTGAGAK